MLLWRWFSFLTNVNEQTLADLPDLIQLKHCFLFLTEIFLFVTSFEGWWMDDDGDYDSTMTVLELRWWDPWYHECSIINTTLY